MIEAPPPDPMWKTALTLAIAGLAGSIVRGVINPESSWRRWVSRFLIGILTAVFLGGLVGHIVANGFGIADKHGYAWVLCACGFTLGSCAEAAIARLQEGIRKGKAKK